MPPQNPTTFQIQDFSQENIGNSTLSGIANQFGVSVDDLVQANLNNPGALPDPNNPDMILAGGTLNIPQLGVNPADLADNAGIASSTDFNNQFQFASEQLDNMSNIPPQFQQLFNQIQGSIDAGADLNRADITTATAQGMQQAEKQGRAQVAGLETLGFTSGLSQYAPGLQIDRIQQAESAIRSEMANLEREEQFALARAEQARADRNLELLREELSLAEDIRREKQRAAERAEEFAFEKEKFEREMALAEQREARLGSEGSGGMSGDSVLSVSEIEDIEDLYGILLPPGSTWADAERLVGEDLDGSGTVGGSSAIDSQFLSGLSSRQLRKVAKKLNVGDKPRQATIEEISGVIDRLIAGGLTIEDIKTRVGL